MAETLIAVLIGAGIIIVTEISRYYVWLYRFRQDWRAERQQWFKEHEQCCELDESFLNEPYG